MPYWLRKQMRPQDQTLSALMYRHVRWLGWLAIEDEVGEMGEPVFEDAANANAYEVARHYHGMTLSTRAPTAPVRAISTHDNTNTLRAAA